MCFLVVYRPKVEVININTTVFYFFDLFETYITFVILRKNDVFLFIPPQSYK